MKNSISFHKPYTINYYHYDGLGSVRQLTDDTETVVAEYTYDGFGNVIASSGSGENTYGFTGEQQFGEADNLVFLRARYYDSRVGRFISRDPILEPIQIGNNFFWFLPYLINHPQDLYSYVYVANNPINRVDPMGLGFWSCVKDALEGSGTDITLTSLVLMATCVAGCGAVTGGVAVGPCLIGCTAAVFGGQAVGLALACLFIPPCP